MMHIFMPKNRSIIKLTLTVLPKVSMTLAVLQYYRSAGQNTVLQLQPKTRLQAALTTQSI